MVDSASAFGGIALRRSVQLRQDSSSGRSHARSAPRRSSGGCLSNTMGKARMLAGGSSFTRVLVGCEAQED
jgi:hypothetical protein